MCSFEYVCSYSTMWQHETTHLVYILLTWILNMYTYAFVCLSSVMCVYGSSWTGFIIIREIRQKTVLNEANGIITYLMNRTFHFEHSSENNYTENDIITTINLPFVVRKLLRLKKYTVLEMVCWVFGLDNFVHYNTPPHYCLMIFWLLVGEKWWNGGVNW